MKKLWENKFILDPDIEAFETGDDLLVDQKLIAFDILGSISHVKTLKKNGILSKTEALKLEKELIKIFNFHKSGKITLEIGDEDMHTKIENVLTEKLGSIGKKIHTGRSRNDQVLTALRLYTKDSLLIVWNEVLELCDSFCKLTSKYEFVPMPGYTHMQKAMPSSVGMWAESFLESLLDDLLLLKSSYELNDQSPLGSGAGYGLPLFLDRKFSASLLGFSKIQNNSLYCQNSRGKIEASVISCLISVLQTINKFVSDILLFTTSEFGFFEFPENFYSGSSIMPQKKNLDIAELLRSKLHLVLGNYAQMVSLSANLPSGYNRDLQDTKKPLMDSFRIAINSLLVTNLLIKNIKPKEKNLNKNMSPEIFAAYSAINKVKEGIPFREAYLLVKKGSFEAEVNNIKRALKNSKHLGGTGNLGLKKLFKKINLEKEVFKKENIKQKNVIKNLLGKEVQINEKNN